ncbi:hypothetical protein Tco_0882282 [Tanacetum coccineum]
MRIVNTGRDWLSSARITWISASNKDAVDGRGLCSDQEFLFLDLKHHPQPVAAVDASPNPTARPVELVPTSAAGTGRQRSAPLTASDAGSEHVGSSSVKLQGESSRCKKQSATRDWENYRNNDVQYNPTSANDCPWLLLIVIAKQTLTGNCRLLNLNGIRLSEGISCNLGPMVASPNIQNPVANSLISFESFLRCRDFKALVVNFNK